MTWKRNNLPYKDRYNGAVEVPVCLPNNSAEVSMIMHQTEDPDSTLWDAEVVLSQLLAQHPEMVQNKSVVELGAGCGLAGVVAAAIGASIVYITDMAEYLPLVQRNVQANLASEICERVKICPLGWGTAEDLPACKPPVDVVLASDCVYAVQSLRALVTTLLALTDYETQIYFAFEHRWTDVEEYFFDLIKPFFAATIIPHEEQHPVYQSPNICIYRLQKLPGVDDP